MPGASTIDIIASSLKPDLVSIHRQDKTITIFELSVPFETNIDNTHERKIARYLILVSDIEDRGYSVKYCAVEVGSRGYTSPENSQRIRLLKNPFS